MSSSFPRLSPSGRRRVTGEHAIEVDGTITLGPGTRGQFATENAVYYTRKPDGAFVLQTVGSTHPGVVLDHELAQYSVNGPHDWVGYDAAVQALLFSNGVVRAQTQDPALTTGSWAGIDRTIDAVLQDNQYPPDFNNPARNPRFGGQALAWNVEIAGRVKVAGRLTPTGPVQILNVVEDEFDPVPIAVRVAGGGIETWLLTVSHACLLLRPWGVPYGYRVGGPTSITPDARQFADQFAIRVVWDDGHDVLGDETQPLGAVRTDLRMPVPIPPDPPTPGRTNMTIIDPPLVQFPVTVAEPRLFLACAPDGGGWADRVQWWYRPAGGAWVPQDLPRNPQEDPDHTMRFPGPGTFDVKMSWESDRGSDGETGARRTVVVQGGDPGPGPGPGPGPQPPDPQPEPTDTLVIHTLNGAYIRVDSANVLRADGHLDEHGPVETRATAFTPHSTIRQGWVGYVASNGRVVHAEGAGGGLLMTNRDTISLDPASEELFRVDDLHDGPGGLGFRSVGGWYWSAQDAGGSQLRCDQRTPSSWEAMFPVPAPAWLSRPISAGVVTLNPKGGFLRNGLPALILSCHNGDGVARRRYDPVGADANLTRMREVGYDVTRTFVARGGDFWAGWGGRPGWPRDKDRRCGPAFQGLDQWQALLTETGKAHAALGLLWHMAGGDLTRETVPDRGAYLQAQMAAIRQFGAGGVFPWEALNECRDTGEEDPGVLLDLARQMAQAFPEMLVGTSAYTGADHEATQVNAGRLNAYSRPPASIGLRHEYRGGDWPNKLERAFNWMYESGDDRDKRLQIPWIVSGEPFGWAPPGVDGKRRVSATDNIDRLNGAVLQIYAVLMWAAGAVPTFMCGPGVISDEGYGTFDDMRGFRDMPLAKSWIPAHAGEFRRIFHGGDRFGHERLFRATEDTRCEHHLHPETGEAITVAYGDDAHHLQPERSFRILQDTIVEEPLPGMSTIVKARVTYSQT